MKRDIKVSLQKPNGLAGKYVRPQTVLLQKYFLFNLALMGNFVIIIFLDCF